MSTVWYGLEDKVVVVTGGSRGIGLELAKALAAQKAKVVICGRKKEGLDAAVAAINGGDRVLALPAHIAKEEDVNTLFESAVNTFGRVDVLVNNVGMNLLTASVIDTEPATWTKIIESNLTGTFLCSRKAAMIMREQKHGRIISISSIAGRKAAPAMGIYGIAKAGIDMLTRVLAFELAQFNIQVNAVAPCMVKTDFSRPFWSNDALRSQIEKGIPMGRIAEVDDVIHPVLFLCSDKAAFITGQVLVVDGGSLS
ncbi:MAG TPA: SDR family oxidoreductase [Spirochaetota bacterium]|nr:SDR family oxidoreductase [Spirochaetota bacterium]